MRRLGAAALACVGLALGAAAGAADEKSVIARTLTLDNAAFDREVARLAATYPRLVRASVLTNTEAGTPIRLLTVTEFASGERKPGYYIQGNIHSKELSGTTVSLRIAELLARDHRPGGILSKVVYYIVPRCNPDGAQRMIDVPGNERSAWGERSDEEGMFEPKDLDGDGLIAQMVRPNPKGGLVRSPRDPRCFVRKVDHPEIKGPTYTLCEEGVFTNWKGRISKKPWGRNFWRRYIDYNRNWEPGWRRETMGAGLAPYDNACTRSQRDFILAHRNIVGATCVHNGWGMVFVPPVDEKDREKVLALCRRGSALSGFPVRVEEETNSVSGEKSTGFFSDFCYRVGGFVGITWEVGTRETSAGVPMQDLIRRTDGYTAPFEVLAMEDRLPPERRSVLPWKKFDHPQLGPVEIGGINATRFANPLEEDLERTAVAVYRFVIEHAESALPPAPSPFLANVRAPVEVAVPPTFAARDLCRLDGGEIRHYGRRLVDGRIRTVYVSSTDGFNWTTRLAADGDPGAMVRIPWSGAWFALKGGYEVGKSVKSLRCYRSKTGPGDVRAEREVLLERGSYEFRQAAFLPDRRRIVCALSDTETYARRGNSCYHATVMYSDDDAKTWKMVDVPAIPDVARRAPGDRMPHWFNDGCEPSLVAMKDGSLRMMVRTSGPYAGFLESRDGGETWRALPPDRRFWQANTMPLLARLSDGRLLAVWNNTAMLPTRDPKEYPELGAGELRGEWETVFTNRDALHAAVSDDEGVTWRGFRELVLSAPRNSADFRQLGNEPDQEHDKSVHQTQLLELDGGKVLLALGQNAAARRMIVFDPDWLLETERHDDFRHGFAGLSNHLYVRSMAGGFRGWAGHCAFNRVPGALLVRDPETTAATRRELLQLCRVRDPRLVSDRQGIVWNFPAAETGFVELDVRIAGSGFRLTLADHWMNPCDETGPSLSPFTCEVTKDLIGAKWCRLRAAFDGAARKVTLSADGRPLGEFAYTGENPAPLSYLHLQTLAEGTDPEGAYFRSFDMKAGRELFNGRDLANWYTFLQKRGRNVDPKGVFSVTNGVIRVTGEEFGGLVSEEEFADYHLTLEYRFLGGHQYGWKAGWAPDSGILFHSTGPDGGFEGMWMEAIEVNLIKGATGDFWGVGAKGSDRIALSANVGKELLGGKYRIFDPSASDVYTITGNTRVCRFDIARDWRDRSDVALAANERPIGEWNRVDLFCTGGDVRVAFNGKFVNRGFAARPTKGRLQLQSEGCAVEFRDIRIISETPLRTKPKFSKIHSSKHTRS